MLRNTFLCTYIDLSMRIQNIFAEYYRELHTLIQFWVHKHHEPRFFF